MILELVDNNIEITEESTGESFIKIQENSKYSLAPRMRNGKFQIPLIALGIVTNICKALKIPVKLGQHLRANVARLKEERQTLESIKAIDENAPLPFQLENYQLLGNSKMTPAQEITVKYCLVGKRVLIANEIGTGKTLSANVFINILKNERKINKCLVMTRSTLVENYYNDYLKFIGNNGIIKIQKETKQKREYIYKTFMDSKQFVLVTNFEKCRVDFEHLKKMKFDIIVCDEFHHMKNFLGAQMSINFFELLKFWNPQYRICMSGTPLENRLLDLYPNFKLLDGGFILGGERFFETNFVEYEKRFFYVKTKDGGTFRKCEEVPIGFKNQDFLKGLIRPLIIRKKSKLPVALYENWVEIELDKKTYDKYEEIRMLNDGMSAKYVASRQFLCDTRRGGIDVGPKLEKFQEILEQTTDKILVFSFFRCTVAMLSQYLNSKNIKHLTLQGADGQNPTQTVEQFKNDPDCKVLVCTDRVNAGLNIQCARIVINWDIPLKPSTYEQRVGRAYRLGQTSDVHAYNFICLDTVEDVIYKNFRIKEKMIREIIKELDNKDSSSLDAKRKMLEAYEEKLYKDIEAEMFRKPSGK